MDGKQSIYKNILYIKLLIDIECLLSLLAASPRSCVAIRDRDSCWERKGRRASRNERRNPNRWNDEGDAVPNVEASPISQKDAQAAANSKKKSPKSINK